MLNNETIIQLNLAEYPLILAKSASSAKYQAIFRAISKDNGPFAAGGHMVHAGGQAAHWDIQNKAASSR